MFDIVVAADLDWGIGKANALPWPKLRGDLQHFKRITSTASEGRRNAIVMGRKTWESKEVAGRALPNRLNVVVSRGELAVPTGVVLVHSLDDALAIDERRRVVGSGGADGAAGGAGARPRETDGIETIFVVGGAVLIQAALERSDLRHVYLTRIEQAFDCDVRMPDLDAHGFVRTPWDGERKAEEYDVRYRIERLARG